MTSSTDEQQGGRRLKTLNARIGRRLRAARHEQQLSLSGLSERTGARLSKSRISNYEQGLRRLGLEEALILAETLGRGLSPAYLLCLEDQTPLSEEEERLVEYFRASDDRGRGITLAAATAVCVADSSAE